MSRPNSSLSRNLTLTEELERLEQSITLTLQGNHPLCKPLVRKGEHEANGLPPYRNRSQF